MTKYKLMLWFVDGVIAEQTRGHHPNKGNGTESFCSKSLGL